MSKNSWEKLGLLFCPQNESPSLMSYCSMPIVHCLGHCLFRLFFSSRDQCNHSSIHDLDFKIEKIFSIHHINRDPILSKGKFGHFDDNGVYSGTVIPYHQKLYMFYSGRSNGVDDLFYMSVGLSVSHDSGKSFQRYRESPILSRSDYDPWLVTAPCVFRFKNKWFMIYTSGTAIFSDRTSKYDLKIATSSDFFNWEQIGKTAIPLNVGESNISTPSVVEINGILHMWFSVKPKIGEYRIGYASSKDGINWTRNDDLLGLDVSGEGFDDKGLSYPNVFVHQSYIYMVYSGNQNGKDGCGLARLKISNF